MQSSHPPKAKRDEDVKRGLLGIGFDGRDGHKRVTSGNDFTLLGGSQETHEQMQDLVMRLEEKAKRRGKRIRDLEGDEFEDLVRESME